MENDFKIVNHHSLTDSKQSIFREIQTNSNKLVIIFGGLAGKLPIPVFEFLKSLSIYNCDKVFIRDLNQRWYQNGIVGYTDNLLSTLDLLNEICSTKNYDSVYFLGNSSGGYAALLFGNLLSIQKTIAFSPQTFISKRLRKKYNDNRWKAQINSLIKIKSKTILDLNKVLKKNKNNTENHIYFSSIDNLDKLHAKRLNKIPHVFLHSYAYGGHGLIKSLKKGGELKAILDFHFKGTYVK